MPTIRHRCAYCMGWRPCPAHPEGPRDRPLEQQRQRLKDSRRPSAAKRGYRSDPHSLWQRTRRVVLARDPICTWAYVDVHGWADILGARRAVSVFCTKPSVDVAHIIPRAQGGSDGPENLRGLCHAHHTREGIARGESWRPRRGMKPSEGE
jgi:5-methylcytosine-specific restriction endonuclease McrA